ncbi:unnamed protein product [Ceratitis capitata]|uniref:(Mediterranean fruit fly) hypothetical protein n=1 Tax=Ceratitis capitata TaxID=7213 RepID=A0A811V7V9_CERCA|nr:unnamed protein product [Ceratitis capitata]
MTVSDIYDKYYKNTPSNALCVPTEYFVHKWIRDKNSDAVSFPNYVAHDEGSVRMDGKVNQAIGIPITNYEYEPKAASGKQYLEI